MNEATIELICHELEQRLIGYRLSRIVQPDRATLLLGFNLDSETGLLLGIATAAGSRLYLTDKSMRAAARAVPSAGQFATGLRRKLESALLLAVVKDAEDRVVRFRFEAIDELRRTIIYTLVAQLTGRSSNLLLLDEHGLVIDTLRSGVGLGQRAGDAYTYPQQQRPAGTKPPEFAVGPGQSPSLLAEEYYAQIEIAARRLARIATARGQLAKLTAQRLRLQQKLAGDLVQYGDAEQNKRIGDLLLANITSAQRNGGEVTLIDYFAGAGDGGVTITLELDQNTSLQEAAQKYFQRYGKAKRAAVELRGRLAQLQVELADLEHKRIELETAIARGDFDVEAEIDPNERVRIKKPGKPAVAAPVGLRTFRSSDGLEVLVGRAARDNDALTFKLARAHDIWLHAADYPGSHVVIRNPSRKEVPQRTVIEAARLAAHYSKAAHDGKVTVHYTEKKFVSKPKGAAPGLVRLAQFKSMTVEPTISCVRVQR